MFNLAYAQTPPPGTAEAANFVSDLNSVIIFPLIGLLSAIALLVFIWGCVQYITNTDDSAGRQQGSRNIMYGIIGLVVMVSAFAILNLVANTFGLDDELSCADDPSQAGCDTVFQLPPPPPTP